MGSLLAERLSTRRHEKKPTKPASGYNFYYQDQAKRVRKREAALQLFEDRVILPGSSSDPMEIAAAIGDNIADLSPSKKTNTTIFIGSKWKNLSKEVKDMYAIQSKAELERYHANKKVWTALDNILQPEVRPLADAGILPTKKTSPKNGKNIAAPPALPLPALPLPALPTAAIQSGLPDNGAFTHGIHEGNEKYRHLMIFLI